MTAAEHATILPPTTDHPPYPRTPRQAEAIAIGARLAEIAARTASRHDRDGTFPHETFAALRDDGLLRFTLPEEWGGHGAGPIETMLALEQLARGDGSVALGTTMHLVAIAGIAADPGWPEHLKARLFTDVRGRGALTNGLASEPDLGSPSRGGGFKTTATAIDGGWSVNGRKTWSTLAPGLTWATVLLAIEEPDGTRVPGSLFVAMDSPGIRIEETWDNLSMRATGSHDVVFENVVVPTDHLLPRTQGKPAGVVSEWSLLTSAVYLGIGVAARDFTVAFAQTRVPTGLGTPIAELQTVQHRLAQIEILLLQARSTLYGTVEAWLAATPEGRRALAWQFAAAKYTVTNHAIQVTDQALRIVGSAGQQRQFPLERYFRDVRAGLGNPPMDDVALTTIGRNAVDIS